MKNFDVIYKNLEKQIMLMAKQSPLDWFFRLHQREVIASAEDLLKEYPEADREIVLISATLHDLGHFAAKTLDEVNAVKPNHHINGAEMADEILKKYDISKSDIEKIKKCILCHRCKDPHVPQTLEEKIVAVADTLSHFKSIFYLVYFKVYPNDTLDKFVKTQREKLNRDWRDLALLPKAKKIAQKRYELISEMLNNYKPE